MWLYLVLSLAHEHWYRPERIQPLNVKHWRSDKHIDFLNEMSSRHREIGPEVRRINRQFGAVTVMVVNTGQFEMLVNFLAACDQRSIPCREMTFVFALDSEAAARLSDLKLKHYHYRNTEHAKAAAAFSDKDFAKVVFYKSAVVYDILMLGVNVLFQDVDVVWKEAPINELLAYNVDISFMNDGNSKNQQPLYINSGFFLVKYNERTCALWREAFEIFNHQNNQQSLLKQLVVHHYFNNQLSLFILPPRFANGNRWTPVSPRSMREEEWVVAHASWTQNVTYKVMKFKQLGEWYLG